MKKSGEITLEEQLELSDLIKQDIHNALLAEETDELFRSSLNYDKKIGAGEVNDALDRLHKKMKQPGDRNMLKKRFNYVGFWVAAASVLLFLSSTIFYMTKPEQAPLPVISTVATKKGSKSTITLPDGTRVWVNADTKLTYDKEFGYDTREVTLKGEAYFDVKHDVKRPFIVHTTTMDVKVLGTAFNVRAYDNEAQSQTTLIRGKVEVNLKSGRQKTILLAPSEKIIVHKPSVMTSAGATEIAEIKLVKIHKEISDSVSNETAWTQNRLVFEQEKLTEILPVLERWYNVKIDIGKVKNLEKLYNCSFENDSLEDVMEALQAIGGFNYKMEKNYIKVF